MKLPRSVETAEVAGKHVLLEKPMAPTLEGCARILAAAKAAGTVFMVAENAQYWPEIVKAQELIKGGDLGEIITARAIVWNVRWNPTCAGGVEESGGSSSTSSAWTANTYRWAGSPGGGAAPPKPMSPPSLRDCRAPSGRPEPPDEPAPVGNSVTDAGRFQTCQCHHPLAVGASGS